MSEYFVLAASSLYWAAQEKPYLFDPFKSQFCAISGASLNNYQPEKNICYLLQSNSCNTNGRKVIIWHDAVNNSLSSKKNPAMSPEAFFSKLAYLRKFNVVAFSYLPRSGAHNLNELLENCPTGIIFLKMKSILSKRYKLLLDESNDLHLNSLLENHMLSRTLLNNGLEDLTLRRCRNRRNNLRNKVSVLVFGFCFIDNFEDKQQHIFATIFERKPER